MEISQGKIANEFPNLKIMLQLLTFPDSSDPICCRLEDRGIIWDDHAQVLFGVW